MRDNPYGEVIIGNYIFQMQNKRTCELKDKHNVHESEWKDPNKKFLHLSHTVLSRLNWNVKQGRMQHFLKVGAEQEY